MAEVQTEYESYYNPFKDLVKDGNEYAETIQVLDEYAKSSGYGDDLTPKFMLTVLAYVEVDEIRNNAARLHHRAQEVYATLIDSSFSDLLAESWQGSDADEFEDYVAGGGGHRGLDLYFEDIKSTSEDQSLSLIALCDSLQMKLDEAYETLTADLADLKSKLDEGKDLVGASEFHNILMMALTGGAGLMGLIAAIPGVNVIVAIIIAVMLGISALFEYVLSKTAEVAENIIDEINSAISESVLLESANVEDLSVTEW